MKEQTERGSGGTRVEIRTKHAFEGEGWGLPGRGGVTPHASSQRLRVHSGFNTNHLEFLGFYTCVCA